MKRLSERYIPGDYFMECDRCGLPYRRSELKRDGWKPGLMVCRSCWDFKPTYPSPPPERISVPIARPKNTDVVANDTTYTYTYIGENLWGDPWCAPENDDMWNDSVLSQDHVRYNEYSRKLEASEEYITVSGLTIGKTYSLKISGWHDTQRTIVYIVNGGSGSYSDIFKNLPLGDWADGTDFFVAKSESITIQMLTGGRTVSPSFTSYIDGVYVQEYITEERTISNADIIANVKPPADILIDNTITPGPFTIEWGSVNIFPDINVTKTPTDFSVHSVSGIVPTFSINSSVYKDIPNSVKLLWPGFTGVESSGGAKYPLSIESNSSYRFKFWALNGSPLEAVQDIRASYGSDTGSGLDVIIKTGRTKGVWQETGYLEFNTPSTITDNYIYFGVTVPDSTLTDYIEYFDKFQLYKKLDETTPF